MKLCLCTCYMFNVHVFKTLSMFRIRSCTVYPIRTVYISASNQNGHLHVHAIHVIHMLIQFMSYHSCDRGYSENYCFSLIFHCFRYATAFRKRAKTGNWDSCGWVRVLSEDDWSSCARYQQTGAVHNRQRLGRPRVTTARADRYITLTHLHQHQLASTVTARQYGVSGKTIRNRLRRNAARTLVR